MSEILNNDDVVFPDGRISGNDERAYTVGELINELKKLVNEGRDERYLWQCLENGGKGKALRANGGGWKPGKIRIRIEFIPDQPEPRSPLDDLRTQLK